MLAAGSTSAVTVLPAMPPAFWLGARDLPLVVAGRDLPSLPVVFSNLGISEVASSFRRTLATVLSSAMVCLATVALDTSGRALSTLEIRSRFCADVRCRR